MDDHSTIRNVAAEDAGGRVVSIELFEAEPVHWVEVDLGQDWMGDRELEPIGHCGSGVALGSGRFPTAPQLGTADDQQACA